MQQDRKGGEFKSAEAVDDDMHIRGSRAVGGARRRGTSERLRDGLRTVSHAEGGAEGGGHPSDNIHSAGRCRGSGSGGACVCNKMYLADSARYETQSALAAGAFSLRGTRC